MGDYFIELRRRITEHQYFFAWNAVIRAILMYTVFAVMLNLTLIQFEIYYKKNTAEYLKHPYEIGFLIAVLLIALVLNTVILSFAIFNRYEREGFLKEHKTIGFEKNKERKVLLKRADFWIEIAVLGFLFLIFPINFVYTYVGNAMNLIPGVHVIPTFIQRAVVYVCFLFGVFGLTLYSRLDVRTMWLQLPGQLRKSKLWKSQEIKERQSYSYVRLALRLGGYLLLYLGGIYAGSFVIPVILSLVKVVGMFSFEGWVWWIVFAFVALILFFTFRRRIVFIRNLKKTCKKFGFRVFDMRHPYLSIFHDGKKYTFGIEANGKIYYCRILASIKRSNKMILDDGGICTRRFSFHIPAPLMVRSGPFLQVADRGNGDDREFFHIDSKANYTFEIDREGSKILIINPVPKRVIRKVEGYSVDADNGDKIGDYQIFTGNAFLRSLKMESVAFDRKHSGEV